MIAVTIQIGNSDNKLSQNEWAHFVAQMRSTIEERVTRIHFSGGSDWDAPWQNACWVCELGPFSGDALYKAITEVRKQFRQDSVAVISGQVTLI